jgi:peptidyl-prolyl cis-trans isomerase C
MRVQKLSGSFAAVGVSPFTAALLKLCRKALREPLVHYFAIALLLVWASELHRRQIEIYRIAVTSGQRMQLADRYAQQFGARPDANTLDRLVEDDIHDEILFREALTVKLDQDDEIVRRRLVQKMRFLLEDVNVPLEPNDAELKSYYTTHAARYVLPARVTFSHIFFSSGQGDSNARSRALEVLGQLAGAERAPNVGDPFPDLYDFTNYAPDQVDRVFGHSEIAEAAFNVPLKQWSGPFRSAYGYHLIYLQDRTEAQAPAWVAVRDRVRADYLLDAEDRTNKIAFSKIARKFSVVRE